jgi:putative DNA primase/helicase
MTPLLEPVVGKLQTLGCDPTSTGPDAFESRCPAHGGKRKNLSVGVGDDGRVLLHCHHVGENGAPSCTVEAIVAALGLSMEDLYPKPDGPPASRPTDKKKKVWPILKAALDASAFYVEPKPAKVEWWDYQDEGGKHVMTVARFTAADGEKTYRPYHQRSDGWVSGDPPAPLPLYRLPELAKADVIFVTEGEKCADAVRALGLTATTSSHGAKAPAKTDWNPLAGKKLVILPDHDAEGEGYAAAVLENLALLTPRPSWVKIVRLPGLADGEDVADWIPRTPDAKDELEIEWKSAPDVDLDAAAVVTQSAPAQATDPKKKIKPKPESAPSHADTLLKLASSAELFHSPDQRCFARIEASGHRENHEIKSTSFRRWLIARFLKKRGKAPSSESLQNAIATLDAKAAFAGSEHEVYVRVAPGPDEEVYIDLGGPAWEAVKVSADGWEITADPPVRFIRPKGLYPLVSPQRGGSLDCLRKFLTFNDDDWLLFIAWLTQSLRPTGPYPVLTLAGE